MDIGKPEGCETSAELPPRPYGYDVSPEWRGGEWGRCRSI